MFFRFFCRNFFCCLFNFLLLWLILLGSYLRLLDDYEYRMLDMRFRLRPAITTTDKILIIEIGDDSIEKLGRFPFARSYHAVLLKALTQYGAKAVVFDIFFSEPQDDDEELISAMAAAGNVYLPDVFELKKRSKNHIVSAAGYNARNLKEFSDVARGTGHINVIPDSDGKFRKVPVFVRYKDRTYPYLSFLVACDYLGIPRKNITLFPGRYLQAGPDLKVPLDENSDIIVNFSGRWGEHYQHCSYVDILQSYMATFSGERPLWDLNNIKDKICLIGVTASGATDLHPNPFETLFPAVGMHADIFNSVMTRHFITRAARWINLLILLVLIRLVSWAACRSKPLKASEILLALVVVFLCAGILLFNFTGWWIDLFYPVLAMVFVYLFCTLCKYVTEWKSRLVLENELQIARQIQESFLPKTLPRNPRFDISAAMFTARQVGGDLYDFLEFNDQRFGVMIGDVSGKGVPASLFMAMTSAAFKSFALSEIKPEETLSRLNEKLIRDSSSNLFVTVFYAVFDFEKNSLHYANGGHLPVLYLPVGKPLKFLDVEEGFPLALVSDGTYSGNRIAFSPGDRFIFYTDGVTEAVNAKKEMFETERLSSLVSSNRNLSSQELLNAIMKDLRRFEPQSRQHDDITIIVITIV